MVIASNNFPSLTLIIAHPSMDRPPSSLKLCLAISSYKHH